MTPQARAQAAIDVLDRMAGGQAAEQALLGWSRGARYAGSGDRAAVRDVVFDVLRARNSCAALGGGSDGRALVLGLLRLQGSDPAQVFDGSRFAPDVLTPQDLVAGRDAAPVPDLPDWLQPVLRAALGDDFDTYCDVLRHRAPVFLRVNAARASVAECLSALAADGIEARPHPEVSGALEVIAGARRLRQNTGYTQGLFELQDAASQAVITSIPDGKYPRLLDYCCGGGGKALALAARFGAPVEAHDAIPERMRDLPSRAARAGAEISVTRDPRGPYDLVVCDVPCSGSGTWRRAPEGKWLFDTQTLQATLALQQRILDSAARLVGPDGLMVYATCSVLPQENGLAVEAFLARQPEWQCRFQRTTLPGAAGDGFFAAHLTQI